MPSPTSTEAAMLTNVRMIAIVLFSLLAACEDTTLNARDDMPSASNPTASGDKPRMNAIALAPANELGDIMAPARTTTVEEIQPDDTLRGRLPVSCHDVAFDGIGSDICCADGEAYGPLAVVCRLASEVPTPDGQDWLYSCIPDHKPGGKAHWEGYSCLSWTHCDATTGACVPNEGYCNDAAQCDDGDACTDDLCIQNVCAHPGTDCNDGDTCTTDACVRDVCEHTVVDCDDDNRCTRDECVHGVCEHNDRQCPPGEHCVPHPPTGIEMPLCVECTNHDQCDDHNPCTDNVCALSTFSCIYIEDEMHEGRACGDGLICRDGECVRNCEDDNPCTMDYDNGSGCSHTSAGTEAFQAVGCCVNDVFYASGRGFCGAEGFAYSCEFDGVRNGWSVSWCSESPNDSEVCAEENGDAFCKLRNPWCEENADCPGPDSYYDCICNGQDELECRWEYTGVCHRRGFCETEGYHIILPCDDGDPCTEDRCEGESCGHFPVLPEPIPGGLACQTRICEPGVGWHTADNCPEEEVCQENNVCGLGCTTYDECPAGPDPCSVPTCIQGENGRGYCDTASPCHDAERCFYVPGHPEDGYTCVECSWNGDCGGDMPVCQNGTCVPNCEDADACTEDLWSGQACTHIAHEWWNGPEGCCYLGNSYHLGEAFCDGSSIPKRFVCILSEENPDWYPWMQEQNCENGERCTYGECVPYARVACAGDEDCREARECWCDDNHRFGRRCNAGGWASTCQADGYCSWGSNPCCNPALLPCDEEETCAAGMCLSDERSCTTSEDCHLDRMCDNGICVPEPCPVFDRYACRGNTVLWCGHHWPDQATFWHESYTCTGHQVCQDGACIVPDPE